MNRMHRHKLENKVFGCLKILEQWGSQSGNIAWIYYCLHCGHMGKRLGTRFVNQEEMQAGKCPKCFKAYKPGKVKVSPSPTQGEIDAFKILNKAPSTNKIFLAEDLKPTLNRMNHNQLEILETMVSNEINNRVSTRHPGFASHS